MAAYRIIKQPNRNKFQHESNYCYLLNVTILIYQNDVTHVIQFKWKVTNDT